MRGEGGNKRKKHKGKGQNSRVLNVRNGRSGEEPKHKKHGHFVFLVFGMGEGMERNPNTKKNCHLGWGVSEP